MSVPAEHVSTDLPDHVLVWLEAVQRRIGRDLEAVLDPEVMGLGFRRIRVLQLIPVHGARQQELAERAMISKQAMAEAVAALEADGLAERLPDPADGRAWLVVRSAEGDRVCAEMDAAMGSVERQLAASLGTARYSAFMDVLRDLGAEQF